MADKGGCGGPILVVDGEESSRALVLDVLARSGFETREAVTGEEALEIARSERPQLVILEVCLPGLCGYEVCRDLKDQFGDTLPVVFVSRVRTETFDRVAGLLIGADDYLIHPLSADELLARVRRLITRVARLPAENGPTLTPRESEVLHLLAEGLRPNEIASRLFISPKTVGTHIEHIFTKLGVRTRAQAVALAYRDELVRDLA